MNFIKRVKFVEAGFEVKRYHSIPTVQAQNVGHHSGMVAIIADELTSGKASKDLIMAALLHDSAEFKVGDIPAPTKHALYISKEVSDLEDREMKSVGFKPIELNANEALILKLSDVLEGMMFCVREKLLGNRTGSIKEAFENYRSYYFSTVNKMRALETVDIDVIYKAGELLKSITEEYNLYV